MKAVSMRAISSPMLIRINPIFVLLFIVIFKNY